MSASEGPFAERRAAAQQRLMRVFDRGRIDVRALARATPGFLRGALLDNWGTKGLAFVLALLVFVVTRDEIQRTFAVPLEVVGDPERVLMTDVPDTVHVEVRGPWTRVNQIRESELGSAVLDLRAAKPGPMELDPASIVMPEGVLLHELVYDAVDLRFEDVIERELPIVVELRGTVDRDYELLGHRVEPDSWVVRGRGSVVSGLRGITADTVSVAGATTDVTAVVSLHEPGDEVAFVGDEAHAPEVRVMVDIAPLEGRRELDVPVKAAIVEALGETVPHSLPATERVEVRGPLSLLRRLGDVRAPLMARVTVVAGEGRHDPKTIEVRFTWADDVAPDLAAGLVVEPSVVRSSLASVDDKPL